AAGARCPGAYFTGSVGVGTSIPLLLTTISMVSVFQRSVVSGSSLRRSSGPPGATLRFLEFANTKRCVTPRSFQVFQIGSFIETVWVLGLSLLKVSVLV